VTVTTDLRAQLLRLIADERRVSDGDSALDLHAGDLTYHAPHRPDIVVWPESTEEVAAVLEYADVVSVPVVAFGAGTSLEGHVIPLHGGISLDLTRMNAIVAVRPDDLTATVQPGVTRSQLEAAVGPHGLWFPVDPGADATLGGMAAYRGAALLFAAGGPISGFEPNFVWLGQGRILGQVPVPVVIFLAFAVFAHIVLRYTRYGRQIYAVGGNPEAARLSGLAGMTMIDLGDQRLARSFFSTARTAADAAETALRVVLRDTHAPADDAL